MSSQVEIRPDSGIPVPATKRISILILPQSQRIAPMKYSNWAEFKINAMELFLHNPEIVGGGLFHHLQFRYNIQYAKHKKGMSISCTDNDIVRFDSLVNPSIWNTSQRSMRTFGRQIYLFSGLFQKWPLTYLKKTVDTHNWSNWQWQNL